MKLIARHGETDYPIEVERHGNGYRVLIGERWLEADFVSVGRAARSLRFADGRQFSILHHAEGNTHQITIAGSTIDIDVFDPLAMKRRRLEDEGGAGGVVKALMPGRVVRILVNKGDSVRKGAGLLILEAMKMENEIQAPVDGTVDEIFVEAGATVESGADLLHIG